MKFSSDDRHLRLRYKVDLMSDRRSSQNAKLGQWGELGVGPAEGEVFDPRFSIFFREKGLVPPHERDPADSGWLPSV